MVTVTATRRFHYGGRDVAVGAVVEMSPLDALVHQRKLNVSLTKVAKPKPTPPLPTPEPVRVRRTYRRRDMQAEQTTALTPHGVALINTNATSVTFNGESVPTPEPSE